MVKRTAILLATAAVLVGLTSTGATATVRATSCTSRVFYQAVNASSGARRGTVTLRTGWCVVAGQRTSRTASATLTTSATGGKLQWTIAPTRTFTTTSVVWNRYEVGWVPNTYARPTARKKMPTTCSLTQNLNLTLSVGSGCPATLVLSA